MDCPHHLPHLCDCGSNQSMVQEELLEMPDTPPPTPPAPPKDDELTDADRKKFGKFLDEFLEDDTTPPTPQTATTPTPVGAGASTLTLDDVLKAIDARDAKKAQGDELGKIRTELDELKKPRKAKWYQPFTMFSPR